MFSRILMAVFLAAATTMPVAGLAQAPATSEQQFDKKIVEPRVQDLKVSLLIGSEVIGPQGTVGTVHAVIKDAVGMPFFIVARTSDKVVIPVEMAFLNGNQVVIDQPLEGRFTVWNDADKSADIKVLSASDTIQIEQKQI